MLGHRRGLLAVDIQPLAHDRRIVVRPVLSRKTLGAACQDGRIGYVELDCDIERLAQTRKQRFQRLALDQVAWIAVEDKATADVGIGQAFFENAQDHLVGDQLARLHDDPGTLAQRCAGLDRGTQKIAGGNMRHLQLGLEQGRLGAFARAVRTEENDAHVSGSIPVGWRQHGRDRPQQSTAAVNAESDIRLDFPGKRRAKLAAAARRVKLDGKI